MQARLEHDAARGPGHALITVAGFGGRETDIAFSLRCASDGKYISAGGRQDAEHRLHPDMVQYRGDTLCLLIGPAIVDLLDALDTFALTIYAEREEGRRCPLEIGNLVYSALGGGRGVGQARPAAPPPPPARAPEPEPEPPAEPEPALTLTPASAPMLPPPGDPAQHKSRLPLILGMIVLLLAAGGAFYWWNFLRGPAPVEQSAQSDVKEPAPARPPAPAEQKPGPPPAEKTPAPEAAVPAEAAPAQQQAAPSAPAAPDAAAQPPLQRARGLLRAGATAQQSLELARSMQTSDAADAAFLLLEDAAQKGNAEAMLHLARFYDPADASPKGSIQPDPAQAREWYEKAKAGGQAAADEGLKNLRTRTKARKNTDPRAKSLPEGRQ